MAILEARKLELEIITPTLNEYFTSCKDEALINNVSKETLKVGLFRDEAWWGGFHEDKLVALSGCYNSGDFGPQSWRLMYRTGVLKKFRGKSDSFSRGLNHVFCWSKLLPLQKDYAYQLGAKSLFLTTNTDSGDSNSQKVNGFFERVLAKQGLVSLIKQNHFYFGCRQNIWRIS